MVSIKASLVMRFEGGTVIRVETSRCFYQVAIDRQLSIVTVLGPGVREEYQLGEGILPSDPDLSDEGLAAMAVTYFEESNQ